MSVIGYLLLRQGNEEWKSVIFAFENHRFVYFNFLLIIYFYLCVDNHDT